MPRLGQMKATEKLRTYSWKIEPSKEGLWIPSRTKGETELVGFRGVIIRQGGISGALHTSPSRLKSQALFRETLANVCHNIQHWLETAARSAQWTDRTPTKLKGIQRGVVKRCRNCGLAAVFWWMLWNKKDCVCNFFVCFCKCVCFFYML